jgi:hypothetical protein
MSDPRVLSLAAMWNPTLIFIILIIIFNLSAKKIMFFNLSKTFIYSFSSIVIIAFLKFINNNNFILQIKSMVVF